MLRSLTAVLTLCMASGCALGLPSTVDAVPFAERLATPVLPDGVYCSLDKAEEDGSLIVLSADNEGESNCAAITWDAASRRFTMSDESGRTPGVSHLGFADLGGGLLLLQFDDQRAAGESDKPWRFTLMAGVAHAGAIAILPLVVNEETLELAARYPSITFGAHPIPFMTPVLPEDAPEDAEPPEIPPNYIDNGKPEDIRSFARDIAVMMLTRVAQGAKDEGIALDQELVFPTLLRDEAGQPDHPPTPAQQRDLDALAKKVAALAKP